MHRRGSNSLFAISILATLVCLAGCANIVTPEGGPRDIKPPSVLSSTPPDRSVSFQGSSIRIFFDEFIQVKDLSSQLFVSPPLDDAPEARIKGRSLLIRLPDSLEPNTTYTLYFGNAIQDITESNPLKGYTYTFATGPVLDSLTLSGRIVNAFTGEPVEDVLLCLYRDTEDSLFLTRRPDFITRSGTDGSFTVFNLPDQAFRVFGLRDANSNSFFDLPNEEVAFDTSLFLPSAPSPPADTVDSLQVPAGPGRKQPDLRLFTDKDTLPSLLKAWKKSPQWIALAFSHPVRDVSLTRIAPPADDSLRTIMEYNRSNDSVDVWFMKAPGDSIVLKITAMPGVEDTIKIFLAEGRSLRPQRRTTATPDSIFSLGSNLKGKLSPTTLLTLSSSYPIDTLFHDRFRLEGEHDTLIPAVRRDSTTRRLHLFADLEAGASYTLICDDSAVRDMRYFYSDSSAFRFSTWKPDESGSLSLRLSGTGGGQWIVSLLKGKNQAIQRHLVRGDQEIRFGELSPGTYRLRAIEDRNGNGVWDSGFLRGRRQPEAVHYYPKDLNVRAKWELSEEWELGASH